MTEEATLNGWTNNEDGPDCTCGEPTVVKLVEALHSGSKRAVLLCLFHSGEAGRIVPLPTQRPANFSDWTIDDVALAIVRDQAS